MAAPFPAAAAEPVDGRRVLLVVDQLEELGPARRRRARSSSRFAAKSSALQRYPLLDRDVAAGRRQGSMPANSCRLRGGGQIDQQTLGDPGRRLGRVEAAVPQSACGQSSRRSTATSRRSAVGAHRCGQDVALELQHLRLVQLEHHRAGRPRRAGRRASPVPRPAGRSGARRRRPPPEVGIEVLGARRLEVRRSDRRTRISARGRAPLPSSRSAHSPPTARQNTSANGSTRAGSGFWPPTPAPRRRTAPSTPTLVVMSQVSFSVRMNAVYTRGI